MGPHLDAGLPLCDAAQLAGAAMNATACTSLVGAALDDPWPLSAAVGSAPGVLSSCTSDVAIPEPPPFGTHEAADAGTNIAACGALSYQSGPVNEVQATVQREMAAELAV